MQGFYLNGKNSKIKKKHAFFQKLSIFMELPSYIRLEY